MLDRHFCAAMLVNVDAASRWITAVGCRNERARQTDWFGAPMLMPTGRNYPSLDEVSGSVDRSVPATDAKGAA
jgi:hypothetical protein